MRPQELREGERLDVQVGDPPDGHAERVVRERELDQGAGRHDGQRGHLLGEPTELAEHLTRGLDLVEEEQRPRGVDAALEGQRQLVEDPHRARVPEAPRQGRIALEVALQQLQAVPRCEVSDEPRLADLARPPHDQRPTLWPGQPLVEMEGEVTVHVAILTSRSSKQRVVCALRISVTEAGRGGGGPCGRGGSRRSGGRRRRRRARASPPRRRGGARRAPPWAGWPG